MGKLMIFFASLFIVGCSTNEPIKSEVSSEIQAKVTDDQYEEYQPNPQVPDDRTLIEPGDSYEDEKGKLTLRKIEPINQQMKLGSIDMVVKEVKIMELIPDYSLIDYFHSLTHEEKFVFAKLYVEFKNNSDERVHFAPIALIKTDQEEAISWEKDIYLEDLNGEIDGQTRKFGNMGFILKNSDIESLTITTSDLYNSKEEKLEDAIHMTVKFY